MQTFRRTKGRAIIIDERIKIVVLSLGANSARLNISGPPRKEICYGRGTGDRMGDSVNSPSRIDIGIGEGIVIESFLEVEVVSVTVDSLVMTVDAGEMSVRYEEETVAISPPDVDLEVGNLHIRRDIQKLKAGLQSRQHGVTQVTKPANKV